MFYLINLVLIFIQPTQAKCVSDRGTSYRAVAPYSAEVTNINIRCNLAAEVVVKNNDHDEIRGQYIVTEERNHQGEVTDTHLDYNKLSTPRRFSDQRARPILASEELTLSASEATNNPNDRRNLKQILDDSRMAKLKLNNLGFDHRIFVQNVVSCNAEGEEELQLQVVMARIKDRMKPFSQDPLVYVDKDKRKTEITDSIVDSYGQEQRGQRVEVRHHNPRNSRMISVVCETNPGIEMSEIRGERSSASQNTPSRKNRFKRGVGWW